MDTIEQFFTFMNERHAIYLRRLRGDMWPWTYDEILQTYKFTNVYRELDAGTKWCKDNIREPYYDHVELFFNIATYRRYNWVYTARELGFIEKYDPEYYTDRMLKRQARGEKIFTGSHMICGSIRNKDGSISKNKVIQLFKISFSELWEKRRAIEPRPGDTLEQAFNRCMDANIPGFGPFVWYEVITDLRWTRHLIYAEDTMSWANPGPGAKRGVQRLLGFNVYKPTAEDRAKYPKGDLAYIKVMQSLLSTSPAYLDEWMDQLEMRDIEHTLCEWDKYERARLGQGAPRSKFTPPHKRKQV